MRRHIVNLTEGNTSAKKYRYCDRMEGFQGFPFSGSFADAFGGFGDIPNTTASPNVDSMRLYETLGVSKESTQKEIKKAYRKLAMQHHPDKGGDEHRFKEINAAYQILSDEGKRKRYDQYGLEGVADENGGGGGVVDIFDLFGLGRSRREARVPRKSPNVNYTLKTTLGELFCGKIFKLAVTRKAIVGEPRQCTSCDGKGVTVQRRELGPGSVQVLQTTCKECKGIGTFADTKDERKVLEVPIERGMVHGQTIIFHGYGDEKPNMEPGDIVFIIHEQEGPVFTRSGDDLYMVKHLSLNEALCGFQFMITHLDDSEILVKSKPGEVYKSVHADGSPFIKVIRGEGMPKHGDPTLRGDLFIAFRIIFPLDGELSQQAREKLSTILPSPTPIMMDTCEELPPQEAELEDASIDAFGKIDGRESNENKHSRMYMGDDDAREQCRPS